MIHQQYVQTEDWMTGISRAQDAKPTTKKDYVSQVQAFQPRAAKRKASALESGPQVVIKKGRAKIQGFDPNPEFPGAQLDSRVPQAA